MKLTMRSLKDEVAFCRCEMVKLQAELDATRSLLNGVVGLLIETRAGRFVTLHSTNGKAVYVRTSAISYLWPIHRYPSDGGAEVLAGTDIGNSGDDVIEVTETPKEILDVLTAYGKGGESCNSF